MVGAELQQKTAKSTNNLAIVQLGLEEPRRRTREIRTRPDIARLFRALSGALIQLTQCMYFSRECQCTWLQYNDSLDRQRRELVEECPSQLTYSDIVTLRVRLGFSPSVMVYLVHLGIER